MEKKVEEKIIILVDIKSVILNPFEDNFSESLKKSFTIIKNIFNLKTSKNESINDLEKKFEKEEICDLNILDYFFENLDEGKKKEIENFIKNNTIFKFQKKKVKHEKLFFEKIDNINVTDILDIKKTSNFKLFLLKSKISKLELKIIDIIFSENKSEIILLEDKLDLIKKEKTYIISKRVELINNLLLQKKINFDFKNFFIYFDNLWMNEKRDIYDQQANEFSLKWDLLILKNLKNKIKILEDIKNKKIEEKNLLKIGINFDVKIIYKKKVCNFIQDFYPLIFAPYNCRSKRNTDDYNIIMAKITESFIFRKINNYDSINKECKILEKKLISWEEKYNKKILFSNFIKNYSLYYDRMACFNFFTEILEDDNFKKRLEENFPGIKIKFPKTIFTKNLNYNEISEKIKKNGLFYPLITKTNIAPRSINKFSHEMIIIKNEESLKTLIKTQPFEIK